MEHLEYVIAVMMFVAIVGLFVKGYADNQSKKQPHGHGNGNDDGDSGGDDTVTPSE